MTNNKEKCKNCEYGCKTFNDFACSCVCHSQPSSVPVEKKECEERWKERGYNVVCGHPLPCTTHSPSTPEVSWESSFEEKYGEINTELILVERGWRDGDRYKAVRNDIKDFIKSVEQKAYERGYEWGVADEERRALEEDVLKDLPIVLHKVEQIKQQATLIESKRVNDILDGMKKDGDDFQCYTTNCFGQTTPTTIEKRLSSQDESYNSALEQAKHLINNTQ